MLEKRVMEAFSLRSLRGVRQGNGVMGNTIRRFKRSRGDDHNHERCLVTRAIGAILVVAYRQNDMAGLLVNADDVHDPELLLLLQTRQPPNRIARFAVRNTFFKNKA